MEEKICNEIALRQGAINEIKELKRHITNSFDDNVKFIIETEQLIGYLEMGLIKRKDKLNISTYTMNLILDEAIRKERERIDKLIDMEIERRTKPK